MYDIEELIYDEWMEEQKERPKEHYKENRFGVGEIIGCLRKAYLNRRDWAGEKRETMGVFGAETAIHEFIQKFFATKLCLHKEFDLVDTERELWHNEENFRVHGFADAIIKLGNLYYVLEIKSTKSLRYVMKKPSDDHIEQVNTYIGMLQGGNSKITRGIILYVEKNTFAMKSHYVSYNPARYDQTLENAWKLFDMLKNNDGSEVKLKWYCDYCKYRDVCNVESE